MKKGNFDRGKSKCCAGCLQESDRSGCNSATWKGHEGIPGQFYTSIMLSAEARNIEFNVSIEYLWDLYKSQNGLCAITKIPIYFNKRIREPRTVSLDRIDSGKGYIEWNVQWVHKVINLMKLDFPQDYFIEWCHKITEANSGK
jgi:hypothetical protein